ncbi:MAG: maltose acetyltransferase domain-containing protein, partial [Pseudomonadota bacterium]
MPSEKQKMISGERYSPGDPELVQDRMRAQRLMRDYNSTIYGESDERNRILGELLGSIGESCALRAPVFVDYGYNVYIEDEVFLNYGCVLLDICPIRIGSKTQIGPGVHPR